MGVGDDVDAVLTGIWNVGGATKDKIEDQASKIIEPIVKKIDDLKDDLETWMGRKFNTIKKTITNSIDVVKSKLKSIKSDLTSIKSNIKAFEYPAFISSV